MDFYLFPLPCGHMVYFPGPLILPYIGPFEILSWKNANRSLEQISCGCHIPLEKGVGLSTVALCFHTYSFSVVSVSLSFSLLIFRKTRVFFFFLVLMVIFIVIPLYNTQNTKYPPFLVLCFGVPVKINILHSM